MFFNYVMLMYKTRRVLQGFVYVVVWQEMIAEIMIIKEITVVWDIYELINEFIILFRNEINNW